MGKDAHLRIPMRTFQDRDEALAWLRAEAKNDPPPRPARPPSPPGTIR
jgi:hypothetical protein